MTDNDGLAAALARTALRDCPIYFQDLAAAVIIRYALNPERRPGPLLAETAIPVRASVLAAPMRAEPLERRTVPDPGRRAYRRRRPLRLLPPVRE